MWRSEQVGYDDDFTRMARFKAFYRENGLARTSSTRWCPETAPARRRTIDKTIAAADAAAMGETVMATMTSYKITDFGGPITPMEQPIPEPTGTEVLVRVTRCGVCHSDIHIADGFYDLGGGKTLSLGERGIQLPRAMGHEALGVLEKAGPDAGSVPVGETRLVYPWVGCGECSVCKADKENYCAKPRSLGVFLDGGYAEYIRPTPSTREIGDVILPWQLLTRAPALRSTAP